MSVAVAIPPLTAEWDQIAARLRADVGEDAYSSWCMGVRLERYDGTVLALSVPTLFLRRHLETHYAGNLLVAAQTVLGNVARLVLRVRQPHAKPALIVASPPPTQPEQKKEVRADPAHCEGSPQIVAAPVQPCEPRRVMIDDIQAAVLRRFGITKIDLMARRRAIKTVRPRQIAMYLAKTLTTRSLPEIGRRFGGLDHTTVMHAIRRIDELQERDAAIAEHVAALTQELQANQRKEETWATSSRLSLKANGTWSKPSRIKNAVAGSLPIEQRTD